MSQGIKRRVIQVPLSVAGIDRAIREVQDYRSWLKERTAVLLDRLAQEGCQIASARFFRAVYDGTNDTSVSVKERSGGAKAVVAVGGAVLFIEFGTGVTYPDTHPEAAKHGMRRGGYGQGKGQRPTWGYYGDPGTNGEVKVNKKGREVVITHGNPANMPMYETVKELKALLPGLVKEVFS